MKKKQLHKIISIVSAGVLCLGASAMFSGCTTSKPEIKITYTFNGKDYEVDYTLSRKSAPRTVEHFIELADAGYYDGLCIHDYSSTYLYTGGYTYDEATSTVVEKNYFEDVKDLNLTQSVFVKEGDNFVGLNTLYGEFSSNGVSIGGTKYTHQAGALVMYYPNKGTETNERVYTLRNDNGDMQDNSEYKYNCATSLFYTYTGTQNSSRDSDYCVFGMASNYAEQMSGDDGLLTAISDYIETLGEEADFTEDQSVLVNQYDPFPAIRGEKIKETFNVPKEPIIIKSVKVMKY